MLFALLLAAIAAGRTSAPLVGLNHLTLVPDSATFAAIEQSAYLRDTFARYERWPSEEGAGVALFGRTTYIEFARPEASAIAWRSKLALGTDERGALRAVASRLTSEVGPVRFDSITRRRDSADVPWLYEAAAQAQRDSLLDVRVVEYHPRWLGAGRRSTVARADVLAMYAAGVAPARTRYPFVDVVGVKIATTAESEPMLLGHCRAVGWRVLAVSAGTACVGPGVRLVLVRAIGSERGIVAFTMRVSPNGNIPRTGVHRLGHSVLRLSTNGFATWEFSETTERER